MFVRLVLKCPAFNVLHQHGCLSRSLSGKSEENPCLMFSISSLEKLLWSTKYIFIIENISNLKIINLGEQWFKQPLRIY